MWIRPTDISKAHIYFPEADAAVCVDFVIKMKLIIKRLNQTSYCWYKIILLNFIQMLLFRVRGYVAFGKPRSSQVATTLTFIMNKDLISVDYYKQVWTFLIIHIITLNWIQNATYLTFTKKRVYFSLAVQSIQGAWWISGYTGI